MIRPLTLLLASTLLLLPLAPHTASLSSGQSSFFRRRGSSSTRRQSPSIDAQGDETPEALLPDKQPRRPPTAAPQEFFEQCQSDCHLRVTNLREARSRFEDLTEDVDRAAAPRLVHFKLKFVDHAVQPMETHPYMGTAWGASEWVWASSGHGKGLLGLPLDADVLSLYVLDASWTRIELEVASVPSRCFVLHSPECRLHEIRKLLINNVTSLGRQHVTPSRRRDYVCHYVISEISSALGDLTSGTGGEEAARLMHRCCEAREFRSGDVSCAVYIPRGDSLSGVAWVIVAIAAAATLCSPVVLVRVKMALKFDSVTKFFRASLKHGITGQRNYVIRISSRQLVDLGDRKPFSLPRAVFRLLFHCYGEGRCCIHWWSEWSGQPGLCAKTSRCRRCWFVTWKIVAVLFLYPIVVHFAVALYAPKLSSYHALVNHTRSSPQRHGSLILGVGRIASALIPSHDMAASLWALFSLGSFLYAAALLSWPDNPLERCLLRYEAGTGGGGGGSRRARDQPAVLRRRLTRSYRGVLRRLAYGESKNRKRHFFRVPCIPWGALRIGRLIGRTLLQIPVVNVCFATFPYDAKLCNGSHSHPDTTPTTEEAPDRDEAIDKCVPLPSATLTCRGICSKLLAVVLWLGFTLLILGYCTAVFVMVEFALSVAFFVCLGAALHASVVLPWVTCAGVVTFYANDVLAEINDEHRFILRLIDENSPRISATEETEEEAFRDGGGGVQILRTHNLGAVKFIDGDSTEYVSKELYHSVCADLGQGWGAVTRRVASRVSCILLYTLLLLTSLQALCSFTGGSGAFVSLVVLLGGAVPKTVHLYTRTGDRKPDRRQVWAKLIPDILDRHIRVDRSRGEDDVEEGLTTYDVRPIGVMDMDAPRATAFRTLDLWKFPWTVSGDQQTQSNEGFVVALANKLAAAAVLTRAITRGYSAELSDEAVLRQWCQLVENCILEAAAAAVSVGGALDAVSLFPREYHALVSGFDAGNTIDSAVDEINRQLYGPFTRGVLVTIGNVACAVFKTGADNRIMAFNASCHGDQVTDVFGAVLLAGDFNAQNLQTAIKYLIDPGRPDMVPVYSIVPVEGYVFRSPEIFDMESSI